MTIRNVYIRGDLKSQHRKLIDEDGEEYEYNVSHIEDYWEETIKHIIKFLGPKYDDKKIVKKIFSYMTSIEPVISIKFQFEMYCQYKCFQPYKTLMERLLNLR